MKSRTGYPKLHLAKAGTEHGTQDRRLGWNFPLNWRHGAQSETQAACPAPKPKAWDAGWNKRPCALYPKIAAKGKMLSTDSRDPTELSILEGMGTRGPEWCPKKKLM